MIPGPVFVKSSPGLTCGSLVLGLPVLVSLVLGSLVLVSLGRSESPVIACGFPPKCRRAINCRCPIFVHNKKGGQQGLA